MLVTYFTHILKTLSALVLVIMFSLTSLNSQVSYSCFCDDSFPEGVLGFNITVFGDAPGETWTVDNVIRLYRSVEPLIVLSNGTVLEADPMNPSQYVISGFAFNGVAPFVTIRDGMGNIFDVNMITCVIPEGEIIGDDSICLGTTAELLFDVTANNIVPGTTVWNTPGAISAVPYGQDDLRLRVEYGMPGSYIISATTTSSTNCDISDDFIIEVFDAADGMEISGPDYICLANATDVMYSVSNPDNYPIVWTTDLGTVSFSPFLGNAMTGSGSDVDVTFPNTGTYTLEVNNEDVNGCLIDNVEYVVQVVDVIDTVQIIGESYVCEGNTAIYTIANAGSYTNLQWLVSPAMDAVMDPADGMAESVEIMYNVIGNYTLTGSGTTVDGCTFMSSLDITVPSNNVPSLACNNSVNVSLNNNCILELLPDMILEGNINDNEAYDIIIEDYANGQVLPNNMVTQDQLGHVFKVTVIEKCGGNSCWGNLVVEDKSVTPLDPYCSTSPIITTCYDFDLNLAEPLGFPDFPDDASWVYNTQTGNWLVSGFDNCSDALLSFDDEVLSTEVCDDPQIIRRIWTAVDINNGEFTTCEVLIHVALTDHNSIVWPKDYDSTLDADANGAMDTDDIWPSLDPCNLTPHSGLLCGDFWYNDANGNPSPDCTGAPFSFGFSCPNLTLIGYKDKVLPVCGSSKKILRQWTIWDACDLTDIMHTQIITLMDTIPPVCSPPIETQVTTDIHECGADIYVEPPVVTGECDEFTYTIRYKLKDQFGFDPNLFTANNISYDSDKKQYVIHDVSFNTDSIWVQYIVRDACGNKANQCFAEFELVDDEQPIPACDFNNFVTLNQYGEAWVGPSTFDDNSWDNCGIYQHVIRRMEDKCECAEPRFDYLQSLGEYNGHYYYLSKDKMHAGKAFALAKAIDAYVARIDNVEENTWLRSRVSIFTNSDYYIGLSGVSVNSLAWQSGSSSYTNWDNTEPSLSYSLKANERVYTSVDEDGLWYVEGRNHLDNYYVVELDQKCHWSQKISFCCEDVGQETMVAMRVFDWHGNHNECMVNVKVMDFIPPLITCPDDVTANCDEGFDESDLSGFGEATAIDDCGTVSISESSNVVALNCGEYIITRVFTAQDVAKNKSQCTQTVTLQNENPFNFSEIIWPDDVLLTNEACKIDGIDPSITGFPTWDEAKFPCSNIAYTYDDLVFYIAEGACQKLVRTWTVIDWCQREVLWEYSQVIKMINTTKPEISNSTCANKTYNNAQAIGNCLVVIDDLTAELIESDLVCSESPLWSYRIDLNRNGNYEINGFGNDASGNYPYGTHIIEWTVIDDCKNSSTCNKIFTIIDKGAPTPYCHGEIVIPISDLDGVEVWASDLNLGSYDDCPGNPVYFSFDQNQLIQLMTIGCSDIDSASNVGRIETELWVWDSTNPTLANKSVCKVIITVQDNSGVCSGVSNKPVTSVSGMIYTEDINMVHKVDMHLESSQMAMDYMSPNGEFAFGDINMYEDYSIEAFKNDDPLNGVSTLDLVMIQRHILGLETLNSPYKIIAADVNNSQSISAIDLIELRKLILGIHDEFPNNYSWRFVEEKFKFLDPLNPFPFSENIQLSNLDKKISNADFVAVKIGDVNKSANTKLRENTIEGRSNNPEYIVNIKRDVTAKGNTRVQFISTEPVNLAGLQLEVNYDSEASELMAIVPMLLDITNEHVAWDKTNEGTVRLSWNNQNARQIKAGEILFELLLSGKQAGLITKTFNASFENELYDEIDRKLITKVLTFGNLDIAEFDFQLYQNIPNPFKDETRIDFVLNQSGKIKFSVTDQTGRLLYSDSSFRNAGRNTIHFNTQSIAATGLLYYQISTETHTATKKMIVIQ